MQRSCGHFIVSGPAKPAAPAAGEPQVGAGQRRLLTEPRGGSAALPPLALPALGPRAAGSRPGPPAPAGAIGGRRAGPGCSRSGVPAAGALREERARCRRFLLRGGRKAARPGSGRGPSLGGSAAVAGQPPSLPQWGRAGRGKGRAPPPRWAME